MVESFKVITRESSHRIAKYAFDYATQHGRKKVTAIHKANIMYVGALGVRLFFTSLPPRAGSFQTVCSCASVKRFPSCTLGLSSTP